MKRKTIMEFIDWLDEQAKAGAVGSLAMIAALRAQAEVYLDRDARRFAYQCSMAGFSPEPLRLVERVAEAIWLANESCRVDTDWDEEENSIKNQYRMLARAAIAVDQ